MSTSITREGLEFLRSVNAFCGNRSELVEKFMEDTSEEHGIIPTRRPLAKYLEYGVINLDKPPGPTSHEVTAWVKKMLGVSRAGHGGTLEPRR